jgi:hypothetical protein
LVQVRDLLIDVPLDLEANTDFRRAKVAVDPGGLDALRASLDRFWKRALAAFKEAAERPTKEVP